MSDNGIESLVGQKDKHGRPITRDTPLPDLTKEQLEKVVGQMSLGTLYVIRVMQDVAQGKTPTRHRDFFSQLAQRTGTVFLGQLEEIQPGKTTYLEMAVKMGHISPKLLNELFSAFGLERIDDFSQPVDKRYLQKVGIDYKSSGEACFIASAAWSGGSWKVESLRGFRDHYLSQHSLGRAFVACYYRYGPLLAGLVSKCPLVKRLVRGMLYPVLWIALTMERRKP